MEKKGSNFFSARNISVLAVLVALVVVLQFAEVTSKSAQRV